MRFPAMLFIAFSLIILLTLPTSNLPSQTCGPGGNEVVTEVAAPRAGLGYADQDTTSDLEVDVENFPHDEVLDTLNVDTTVEFHSGFGWQCVDFDGTPAYYIHTIILFYVDEEGDTIYPGDPVQADTTIYLNSEDVDLGWLCTFETYSDAGTYERNIFMQSRIENSSGDTLAMDTDIETRTIVIE